GEPVAAPGPATEQRAALEARVNPLDRRSQELDARRADVDPEKNVVQSRAAQLQQRKKVEPETPANPSSLPAAKASQLARVSPDKADLPQVATTAGERRKVEPNASVARREPTHSMAKGQGSVEPATAKVALPPMADSRKQSN